HFIPGVGFFFKLANFIVTAISSVIKGLFKIARRGQASHPVLFAFNPESAAVDGEEPGLRVGSPEYPAPASFYGNTAIKDATQSTSAETGALTVAGGLGVKKDLRVGGEILSEEGKSFVSVWFVYFQLPGKSAPDKIFVGVWLLISSSFAGLFFRAEGGNASEFGSGVQNMAMQNHTHNYLLPSYPSDSGAVFYGSDRVTYFRETATTGTSGTGVETRPVNITIRIWERV
ncbi:hypothetical protein, partial [Treponema endosymbiont of Eucomonympha sp.]